MNQRNDIFLGLAMFFTSLIWAVHQHWSVTDLLWSLWLSSMLLGYTYLLTAIAGMLAAGHPPRALGNRSKNGTDGRNQGGFTSVFFFLVALFITGCSWITLLFFVLAILSIVFSLDQESRTQLGLDFLPARQSDWSKFFITLPTAIFMVAFFSFHFIFFHFVHSIFLNGFFPLLPESPFGKTVDGTFVYFWNLITLALERYWPFVLFSGFSRISLYVQAFKSPDGAAMFIPYKNVVRMHITLFLLAFLSVIRIPQAALYLVFIIYFLPVGDLLKKITGSKRKWSPPDPSRNNPIQ